MREKMYRVKRLLSALLVMTLILTSVPVTAAETSATETLVTETPSTEPAYVSLVKLNKSKVNIVRGNTYTLKATITGTLGDGEKLKWSSSDKTVAKVSSKGKITAMADGKATITVKAPSGKKATCTVYVSKPTKVKLEASVLTMTKGRSYTLGVTLAPATTPKEALTWTSSDKSILTVNSNGKVTAVKNGTAKITVTAANKKKAVCTITVVTPKKVELNKSKLTLTKSQTYTLKATVSPTSAKNAPLTWKSSNKKVVKVSSSGKLTAVGTGTATITVTTGNNKKDTCKVTVVAPTKVTLSKTSVTGTPGQSFTLKATIAPSSANAAALTWKSSNKNVATVTSKGKVKIVGTGTATITVSTKNGKKATCTVTSKSYLLSGGKLTVGSSNGTKTYKLYAQGTQYYYKNFGCVTTAVAIAASAFGSTYTPQNIHEGSASAAYSERYAVSKMGASTSLYGSAISVRLASQILTDMGIKNVPIYSFTKSAAIQQIKEHLAKGKPVIVKANNTRWNGVQVANAHHAMVLVGIDESGYGIFIEPFNGQLNYAHGNGTYFKRTVEQFVNNHMTSATGNVYVPYVTGLAAAGGYILVG